MLDPTTTLSRLGGLARGRALAAHGISRKAIARAVDAGKIVRVRAGVFAVPRTSPPLLIAAAHGGAVSCSTALRLHRVWPLSDGKAPHVWPGRNGRAHPHEDCRCVGHHFDGATRFGVVDVETALLHLYRCEGDESFFASLESAWRLGLVGRAARHRIRAALPANARWLVDFAQAESDSGLESILRLRLHVEGIALASQVAIPGVGRVDFVIDGCLIIEVDGKENHAGPTQRHRDLTRDAVASTLGYESLRFDYAQLIHDWPTVSAAIHGALRRARARL